MDKDGYDVDDDDVVDGADHDLGWWCWMMIDADVDSIHDDNGDDLMTGWWSYDDGDDDEGCGRGEDDCHGQQEKSQGQK